MVARIFSPTVYTLDSIKQKRLINRERLSLYCWEIFLCEIYAVEDLIIHKSHQI